MVISRLNANHSEVGRMGSGGYHISLIGWTLVGTRLVMVIGDMVVGMVPPCERM